MNIARTEIERMKPTSPQEAACAGKYRFKSFTRADRVARRMRQRRDTKTHAYLCPHCHYFHVGGN